MVIAQDLPLNIFIYLFISLFPKKHTQHLPANAETTILLNDT